MGHRPICSAAVNALIAGIELKVFAPRGERSAFVALQAIEAQTPMDPTAFAVGKAVLVLAACLLFYGSTSSALPVQCCSLSRPNTYLETVIE